MRKQARELAQEPMQEKKQTRALPLPFAPPSSSSPVISITAWEPDPPALPALPCDCAVPVSILTSATDTAIASTRATRDVTT